jgi:hypothetical protein
LKHLEDKEKRDGNMAEFTLDELGVDAFTSLIEDSVRMDEIICLLGRINMVEKKDIYLLTNIINELNGELKWKIRNAIKEEPKDVDKRIYSKSSTQS